MLRRFLLCLFVTVALGGAIELIQFNLSGRTSSLLDLMRDVSGSMIAFSVLIIKEGKSKFVKTLAIASVSAILSLSFFSLVTVLRDEVAAWNDFPVLAGFEHKGELQRWESGRVMVSRVMFPVRSGRYSLKVKFSTAEYSGLSLVHFPRDWRGRDWLLFSVYNPDDPVALHFRVHDTLHSKNQAYGNRYNGSILLTAGWNDIQVDMRDIQGGPDGREMDLADIQGFGIFVMKQQVDRVLYLDGVRLE